MLVELEIPVDETDFDHALEAVPNCPAVFLLWPPEGKPYLARTNVLRRRLLRLLGPRQTASRSLNLRGAITRIEYSFTGSRLEAQFLLWELARSHFASDYRREIRLRLPPYVKLVLSNRFPRTVITTRIGRAPAVYFGPFRNRATASLFDSEVLNLFQLRRCQDDLAPNPEHPGCMYGEMGRCLRPCQQVVNAEEYRGEAERVADFLHTSGASLLEPAATARERLSAEMDFEGAALMHQRLHRVEEVLALGDEMARDIERLNAVVIAPSAQHDAVELGWMRSGYWQGFTRLEFTASEEEPVSLDARLRETAATIPEDRTGATERMEQLAILSRWFYSTWRDGEMLPVDDWSKLPYRKLVNAVSRVAGSQRTSRPSSRS
jgi:excinuclease ABC subunit C